ncbi:MAG: sugar ABC transporter permease [Ruminiclostridium sp.]|nr:sugar ABC transporter permease [Ruminiclostridium sp.]
MNRLAERIIKNKWGYLFLLPWVLLFTIFIFLPFVIGLILSMYEYNFAALKFAFFDNFILLFQDSIFLNSIATTLLLAVIIVPVCITLALWVSNLIFNSGNTVQSLVKAGFYVPAVISSAALVITWKWIFNPAYGLSKYFTDLLGAASIDWYGSPVNAVLVVSILLILILVGQPIILYSAAMGGIPVSYYEAANIDGATGLQKFFNITLPLLKPTTLFIMVTMTIGSLQIFEIPMLLTAGGPQFKTTTILYLLYKTAFEYTKFGLASAMGVVLFIIIAIIALIQFKYLRSDIQY